jgi:hypothetical protein
VRRGGEGWPDVIVVVREEEIAVVVIMRLWC